MDAICLVIYEAGDPMGREMYSRREVLDILQITEAQLKELVEGNHILEIGGKSASYHVEDVEQLLGAVWFHRKYGRKEMNDAQTENEKMILWLNTEFRDELREIMRSGAEGSGGVSELATQHKRMVLLYNRLQLHVLDSFLSDGMVLGVTTMSYINWLFLYMETWTESVLKVLGAMPGDTEAMAAGLSGLIDQTVEDAKGTILKDTGIPQDVVDSMKSFAEKVEKGFTPEL